jgi:hypothetical protein
VRLRCIRVCTAAKAISTRVSAAVLTGCRARRVTQVDTNRRGIVKEGGVRGLVLALGRHGSKEYVVHGACRALGQLIFDNPRTAQVRTGGLGRPRLSW